MTNLSHLENLDNFMPDVIGQHSVKRALAFYLRGYHSEPHTFKTVFLSGCKGAGKSLIGKSLARELYLYEKNKIVMKEDGVTPRKKPFIEINVSTIKNVRDFIQGIFLRHIIEKSCTVMLDEIHMLRSDMTNFLLSVLNPTPTNRNEFTIDETTVTVDFSLQTFILCSSEPHLVFSPLKDRMVPINLVEYSNTDLAKILQKFAPEVTFVDNVLEEISGVLRQSARCATAMADNVKTYLCGRKKFGMKDWSELKRELSILPYGINHIELSLLRIMSRNITGNSLNSLSAKTQISREAIMREYESYLQKLNFLKIEQGAGRKITEFGLRFLDSVKDVVI